MPFSPLQLIIGIFVLGLLVSLIQVGALTIAFEKLGLSQNSAFLLLISSLLGSAINLPVTKVSAERPPVDQFRKRCGKLTNEQQHALTARRPLRSTLAAA